MCCALTSFTRDVETRTMALFDINGMAADIISITKQLRFVLSKTEHPQQLSTTLKAVGGAITVVEAAILPFERDEIQPQSTKDRDNFKELLVGCGGRIDRSLMILKKLSIVGDADSKMLAYRDAVKKKHHRIEELCRAILQDVLLLAYHSTFTPIQDQSIRDLKAAMEQVNCLPPSLSDSAFEKESCTHRPSNYVQNRITVGPYFSRTGKYFVSNANGTFEGCYDPRDFRA